MKPKKLTEAQKKRLAQHSKSHGKKHMDSMRAFMAGGLSFTEAHKRTKKMGY